MNFWVGIGKVKKHGIKLKRKNQLNHFRELQWWRRRESNPRPQMLPSRVYMLSSRLEDSHLVGRGNRADQVLVYVDLTAWRTDTARKPAR